MLVHVFAHNFGVHKEKRKQKACFGNYEHLLITKLDKMIKTRLPLCTNACVCTSFTGVSVT